MHLQIDTGRRRSLSACSERLKDETSSANWLDKQNSPKYVKPKQQFWSHNFKIDHMNAFLALARHISYHILVIDRMSAFLALARAPARAAVCTCHNYYRHLGIADGASIARVWVWWYPK